MLIRVLKFRWLLVMALAVLLVVLYLGRSTAARLVPQQSPEGQPMVQVIPATKATQRVLIIAPDNQQLSAVQLLTLAEENQAQAVQLSLPTGDCAKQAQRLSQATALLGGAPTLVAGIDNGAAYAWRWLAAQTTDQARAVSVGCSLQRPDCTDQPLPSHAPHGTWLTAWNENPDPDTSVFVRNQSRTENVIGNYGTPLAQILFTQLKRSLQGQGDPVPVIEVLASQPAQTVTFFYSGDGGWRDLDREAAQYLAKQGYPVVGIDALRYFWQHKTPEQVTADLEQLMQSYQAKWGARTFVLAGYSFGADILPLVYNQLPPSRQQQTKALLLLALARSGSFEIEVQGWMGKAGEEIHTAPELVKVPAEKIYCVYGSEEDDESGCTLPEAARVEKLRLIGGHHFDGNYQGLAQHLLEAIQRRLTP